VSELIDNRAFRIRTLKHIIKQLHSGVAPQEVKTALKTLVRETDASEIAAMEQELIAEGMPVTEVQRMCDLHSEVLREVMIEPEAAPLPEGHPAETFQRENEALERTIGRMRDVMNEISALPDDSPTGGRLDELRLAFNDLMDVEKHYQRKEHLLFSCLERHEIVGPSKVMWGKDDEVRTQLKAFGEALKAEGATADEWKVVFQAVGEPALAAVMEMIYKEEKILLPMCLSTLTPDEWGEIWSQSPEYGWCLIEPGTKYSPPEAKASPQEAQLPQGKAVVFPTGSFTYEQLKGLFAALPVDLTFVDADDRVRYFSEDADRVFARSKAILGRTVQHCHPPKSVNVVEQIVSDFRSGRQNVAEFWINFQGRFIHIRYIAVRDERDKYLGTLEVTQDLTHLRALEGERRLLEYGTEKP